jgi:acyl-coenzyme A synthetase/AMP-(fatty) acid ligase
LKSLPEVADAVVTGLPDEEFGELVVAAVVLESGAVASEQSLRDQLRSTLSSFKVPRRIIFAADTDIPRTTTGKIKLHELRQLFA